MNPTKHILIIDDDTSIRTLLDTAFTNAGYTVTATGDGQSALTLAKQGGFSVILADIRMPRMDGLTFLIKINQTTPQKPNGPIIVFSSMAQDDIKDQALASGAAAYLIKDEEDLSHLPQKIETILNSPNLSN